MSDREFGGIFLAYFPPLYTLDKPIMLFRAGTDDLSLPKATVQKIIVEILASSPGTTFAKDARDLLIDCCVEFITLISSEANEIAEKEAKKTIATEHVDKALRELGFPEYVEEVLAVAGEHKEQLKVRSSACLLVCCARGIFFLSFLCEKARGY